MGSRDIVSAILLWVGVIVLVLSLVADLIGIGAQAGFGISQIMGTIVGVIVTVVGLVLMFKKRSGDA